jgi:hypothetical protein
MSAGVAIQDGPVDDSAARLICMPVSLARLAPGPPWSASPATNMASKKMAFNEHFA